MTTQLSPKLKRQLNWFAAFYFLICMRPAFLFQSKSGIFDDPSYVKYLRFLIGDIPYSGLHGDGYAPGVALAWFPAGIVSKFLNIVFNLGLGPYAVAGLGSAVIGFWGFRNLVVTAKKIGCEDGDALLASASVFFGCQLLYYLVGRGTLAHSGEFFFITLLLRLWVNATMRFRHPYLLSLLCGVVIITRVNDFGVLWLLLPLVFEPGRKFRISLKRFTYILPAVAVVIGNEYMVRYNMRVIGSDFVQSPPGRLLEFTWQGIWFQLSHFFFGNSGGVLIISPVIVFAIFCWIKNFKNRKPFGDRLLNSSFNFTLLTILIFNVYIVAIWQGYGGEYGYRYIYGSFPFLGVAIMSYLKDHNSPTVRKVLGGLTIWGFYFYWVYNVAPETMMHGPFKFANMPINEWNPELVTNSLTLYLMRPGNLIRCFGLSLPGAIFANVTGFARIAQYTIPWNEILGAFLVIPGTLGILTACERVFQRLNERERRRSRS